MPRWDPQAQQRLHDAAVELFVERGYENVTVSQIAARAGLTRRTFSRYFADKRDVLFAGADDLPRMLAGALKRADPALPPFGALLDALVDVGGVVGAAGAWLAAQRRAVVAQSPELQERGRTKFAAVANTLAAGLIDRGSDPATAGLLAEVAVAVFRAAFDRWVDDPSAGDLPARMRETATELAGAVMPAGPVPVLRAGTPAGALRGGT